MSKFVNGFASMYVEVVRGIDVGCTKCIGLVLDKGYFSINVALLWELILDLYLFESILDEIIRSN